MIALPNPYSKKIEMMQINLTAEQFYILEDLISRGMEDKLAPFDDIKINADQEEMINETLAAVAFFNSHKITAAAELVGN